MFNIYKLIYLKTIKYYLKIKNLTYIVFKFLEIIDIFFYLYCLGENIK